MIGSLFRPVRHIVQKMGDLYHKCTCLAPVRPVVLIQSDDWGRVGAPSLDSIQKLKEAGYSVGQSPWDYYGLESEEDLEALGELLLSYRDADGHNAVMTAVFVMANADLERMRTGGYKEFHPVSINQGFPSPWQQTNLASSYRELVKKGILYPALHGYTHFNSEILLSIAREDTPRGARVRALHECNIPYLASLTPEFNFALLDRSGSQERFIKPENQSRWINEGARIFQEIFGTPPLSTCAPGYRFNAETCALWKRVGIQVAHISSGKLGHYKGIWFTPRNVHFEPLLNKDAMESALTEADRAVKQGNPIIISSHSINYITRHLSRAAEGRDALSSFLRELSRRYPDLRFANEVELFESWCRRDIGWWRRPNTAEIKERCQA